MISNARLLFVPGACRLPGAALLHQAMANRPGQQKHEHQELGHDLEYRCGAIDAFQIGLNPGRCPTRAPRGLHCVHCTVLNVSRCRVVIRAYCSSGGGGQSAGLRTALWFERKNPTILIAATEPIIARTTPIGGTPTRGHAAIATSTNH